MKISFINEKGEVFLVKTWSTPPSMGDTISLGFPNTRTYLVIRREWPLSLNDDFERIDIHVQEEKNTKRKKT